MRSYVLMDNEADNWCCVNIWFRRAAIEKCPWFDEERLQSIRINAENKCPRPTMRKCGWERVYGRPIPPKLRVRRR